MSSQSCGSKSLNGARRWIQLGPLSFQPSELARVAVVVWCAMLAAKKGDRVRIVVSSDAPDDIHLHGYDIEKPVEKGKPARFDFVADIEGIFELESHVAEDAGRDPLVGKLTVEPS